MLAPICAGLLLRFDGADGAESAVLDCVVAWVNFPAIDGDGPVLVRLPNGVRGATMRRP